MYIIVRKIVAFSVVGVVICQFQLWIWRMAHFWQGLALPLASLMTTAGHNEQSTLVLPYRVGVCTAVSPHAVALFSSCSLTLSSANVGLLAGLRSQAWRIIS